MAKTAFVHDPKSLQHLTGAGHPERPERTLAIERRLADSGLLDELRVVEARPADEAALLLVHDHEMCARAQRLIAQGAATVDAGDTAVSAGSWRAALGAAGAALDAVDGVMRGDFHNAFAMCRPPGHHAERDRAMGFCLANNVAIAAEHLRRTHGLQRVAILDWDVHHGNGTQHIFERDAGVFYASLHQYPHYPGTGAAGERGEGPGAGTTRNAPLPAGSGDAEWIGALERLILPELEQFAPEFVLVSAGFDAHARDPLSGTLLTTAAYAAMTARLGELARRSAQGRLVALLEGGYDLDALAASAEAHVRTLVEVAAATDAP